MKLEDEARFKFGANWRAFVDSHFSDERVELAANSLKQFLRVEDLSGRSFLDIGCGSGLFSLAALRLGARRVVSIDFDADSVATSEQLRTQAGIDANRWQVLRGSVLDEVFMKGLGTADIVYSWGVLHHTGQMWRALDQAIAATAPGGKLAISIYNKVDRIGVGSNAWVRIKKAYVGSPLVVQRLMEQAYVANYIGRHLITLRNPFKRMAEYKLQRSRGMSFWHDVRDWVGGYPYEFATAGEIFNYVHEKHGLQLEYLTSTHSLGCNEFLFLK